MASNKSTIQIEKNRNGQYIWVLQQETEAAPEALAQSPGTYRNPDEATKAAEKVKDAFKDAKVLGVKDAS